MCCVLWSKSLLQRQLFQVDKDGCHHALARMPHSGYHKNVKMYTSLGKGEEGQDPIKNVKYALRTKSISWSPALLSQAAAFLEQVFQGPLVAHSCESGNHCWSRSTCRPFWQQMNSQVLYTPLSQASGHCPRAKNTESPQWEIVAINITRLTRRTGEVTCAFVPICQPRLMVLY